MCLTSSSSWRCVCQALLCVGLQWGKHSSMEEVIGPVLHWSSWNSLTTQVLDCSWWRWHKVIFRVGEKCYDPQMGSASMWMTSALDTAVSDHSYTVHQLPNTKLEDITQMCHRFLAQSQWPTYVVPTTDARLLTHAGRLWWRDWEVERNKIEIRTL